MRFYAWAVPIGYVRYVHCGMCGNMNLQRISHEYGEGPFAWLFKLFHAHAYRCAPCRNRFFSLRRYHRIVPIQEVDTRVESHSVTD
jgi:hypothetical protein